MKVIGNKIKTIISHTPKFMLLVIALSLMLHEFYPFSHFPMYSTFGASTHYIFLADSEDKPIAIRKYFKYSAPKLKKMYMTRRYILEKAEKTAMTRPEMEREAARWLLSYLIEESDRDKIKPIQVLKLYLVDIQLEEKELTRKHTLLAEVKLR